jgi:hypothetical protein
MPRVTTVMKKIASTALGVGYFLLWNLIVAGITIAAIEITHYLAAG